MTDKPRRNAKERCWICHKHPPSSPDTGLCSSCSMVTGLAMLTARYHEGAASILMAMRVYAHTDGTMAEKAAAADAELTRLTGVPTPERTEP